LKKCVFESQVNPDGGYILTCAECGRVVRAPHTNAFASCPKPKVGDPYKPPKPPRDLIAVGDIVASALEKIGVTKALVEKVTGTQGKPGGCGCQQRQNTLNQVGYVVQEKMHDGFDAAKQFMGLGE
jgi:hypothetical protein